MMEQLLVVPNGVVRFHAYRSAKDEIYLIDSGFLGGLQALQRALKKRGWDDLPIRGIFLSHGHLDHTLNLRSLSESHDLWIAAPFKDRALVEGDFGALGWGRIGGWMQSAGAKLFRYRPPQEVRWYEEETVDALLPDGLEAVPLPGHTSGHMGFLHRRVLLSGDAFSSLGGWGQAPPAIFNHDTAEARRSLRKIARMDLDGIFPNHSDGRSPEDQLARLRALVQA